MWEHYKSKHKDDDTTDDPTYKIGCGCEDTEKLESELKTLKSNFERLENILKDTLDEAQETKNVYEQKLNEANDSVRDATAENVILKERVEILFKLSKSYLNRSSPKEVHVANPEQDDEDISENETHDKESEVLEVENESLKAWTTNKLRGFKKTKENMTRNTVKVTSSNRDENETPKDQEDNNTSSESKSQISSFFPFVISSLITDIVRMKKG